MQKESREVGIVSEDLLGFAALLVFDATKVDSNSTSERRILVSLSRKLVMHLATIYHLFKKTPIRFEGNERSYPDLSSIHSLLRIALENFAQLYEVFFESESDDTRNYRFHAFWIEAMQYQKPPGWEQSLRAEERVLVERLRENIRTTIFYTKLNSEQKKAATKSGRRFVKRNGSIVVRTSQDILIDAGFHKDYVGNLYSFGNSNIHTDAFSGGQLDLFYSGVPPYLGTGPLNSVLLSITAKFIGEYVKLFPEAQQKVDAHPVINQAVEMILRALLAVTNSPPRPTPP